MINTMSEIAGGWDLHVDRGPNWLLVRVRRNHDGPREDAPLAQQLWELMEEHFVYRVALELDDAEELDNRVIRQLGRLDHVAREHGGFVRLCGLSRHNWRCVVRNGLADLFYPYVNRKEAVFASHPQQDWERRRYAKGLGNPSAPGNATTSCGASNPCRGEAGRNDRRTYLP